MKRSFCSVEGKVVVITGGAGLLGRQFARAIAENGGTPVVADIDADKGQEFVSALKSEFGCPSLFLKTDITDRESVVQGLEHARKTLGRVDALVNNAYPRNARYGRGFFEVAYEDFCDNVSTHLGGYFLCSQVYGRFFKEVGGGAIVNMSSVYGVVAPRFEIYQDTMMTMPVEYAAIKAAVVHLTKYTASFFKNDNIRVNCISPGGIAAGQPETFVRRYRGHCLNKGMLNEEDIVGTLVFLLSDESRYINGQNIIVDDGFTL